MGKERKTKTIEPEIIDEIPESTNELTPVEDNSLVPAPETCIVSDQKLVGIYDEIMDNLREDRQQVAGLVDVFSNMVVNNGESSTSSKEALVNLMKTKIETADRMAKVADLMTRIKLKSPDTYKPFYNKKDTNVVNIYDSSGVNRKALFESIERGEQ